MALSAILDKTSLKSNKSARGPIQAQGFGCPLVVRVAEAEEPLTALEGDNERLLVINFKHQTKSLTNCSFCDVGKRE